MPERRDRAPALICESDVNHSPNLLLASLAPEIFGALKPHLSLVEYKHGQILSEPGDAITAVHFPHSGIVSLVVVLQTGDVVETAMIGRDGALHAACALDGKVSLNRAIVQLPGHGSSIPAQLLSDIADEFPDLRRLLIRHEQVVLAQAQQSGACNASHLVEARLCRWLLRCRDLARSDDLLITQEFMAQMLGVRRSSLSLVANTLQKAGLISYRRGRVHVINAAGLKEAACECYDAVREHYDRLLNAGHLLGGPLSSGHKKTDQQDFDDARRKRGTGQDVSDKSQ